MTSKEYLMQIYNLDHKIYMMQLEADEYRRMADATGIRSVKDVGMIYIDGEPLQIFDITLY